MQMKHLVVLVLLAFTTTGAFGAETGNRTITAVGASSLTDGSYFYFNVNGATPAGCSNATIYIDRGDTELYDTVLAAYLKGKVVNVYYVVTSAVTIPPWGSGYNCKALNATAN